MKKFLVLYLAPARVLEEWLKTDEEVRKPQEAKMKEDWDIWMKEYGALIKEVAGAGGTKRVTKEGITDIKNDIMLYALAEAESHEELAKAFENHPHFGIPEASIEIMPLNYLTDVA